MNSKVNRRKFLTTVGMGVAATQVLPLNVFSEPVYSDSFSGEEPKFWIDSRFTGFITPWRKVHLRGYYGALYI